jgi:diguanylate cyclase (GGDEF)-like protein
VSASVDRPETAPLQVGDLAVPNDIQQELRKAERRESQLWVLALGLLIVLGGILVAHYAFLLPNRLGSGAGAFRSPGYTAVAGLSFLIVLFCLYVFHVLLQNGRLKSLLVEMNGMAASGMELDAFLPSVAGQIARTVSVNMCEIALLSEPPRLSALRHEESDGDPIWQTRVGRVFPLEQSTAWRRVVETLGPVVLRRSELDDLSSGSGDAPPVTDNRKAIESFLAVPMMTDDRLFGVVILGRTSGFFSGRFGTSTIDLARTLARHAATAIDQARLKREAIHDPLTNLYNRRHFTERLKEEISRSERNGQMMAVLLCDLDRFKAVNDSRGHQAGDELLKAVARSIKASTRGTDLVFRWGGDEIVVVLSNTSRTGTLVAANRIGDGVRRTGIAARLDIGVSIGIALFPEHGRDEDELVRTADRALFIAKKSGDQVRVGEEDYQLDRDSIKVVFQPVVELSSERVLGYEALSRDPQGKLSTAELFEKYSRIGQLKELKQITLTSQIELAAELGLERVFVNADFEVLGQLDPLSIPAGMDVVVELSEREALNDLENHLEVARRWRSHGYKFAIDDFGAGFISFPFLAALVPEYVKVDRSTMLEAVSSTKFKALLRSLLQAVRAYATAGIIAEGIEREEELELTRELGISHVQGFLFGRPRELTRESANDSGTHEAVLAALRSRAAG